MAGGVHSRLLSIALYILTDYNNSCSWLVLIQANYIQVILQVLQGVLHDILDILRLLCYIAALSIYMSVNLYMSSGVGRGLKGQSISTFMSTMMINTIVW